MSSKVYKSFKELENLKFVDDNKSTNKSSNKSSNKKNNSTKERTKKERIKKERTKKEIRVLYYEELEKKIGDKYKKKSATKLHNELNKQRKKLCWEVINNEDNVDNTNNTEQSKTTIMDDYIDSLSNTNKEIKCIEATIAYKKYNNNNNINLKKDYIKKDYIKKDYIKKAKEYIEKANEAKKAKKAKKANEVKKANESMTTQLRILLHDINNVKNKIRVDNKKSYIRLKLDMFIKMIYQEGKERKVKNFFRESGIESIFEDNLKQYGKIRVGDVNSIINNNEEFLLYAKYVEAIVAYSKYRESNENTEEKVFLENIIDDYVEVAKEQTIKLKVTTTQLRIFLNDINKIKDKIKMDIEKSYIDEKRDMFIKMIYQEGKESKVKNFFRESGIESILEDNLKQCGEIEKGKIEESVIKNNEEFLLYAKYIESLVAWDKYINYKKEDK